MNGARGYDYDAIRRDFPLPQIVASIVKLQRAGSGWKACCPLHDDRTPSFTIYEGGQRFYCFGCQACGDVIDFVSAYRGISLGEAARSLQRETLLLKRESAHSPRDDRDKRDKSDRGHEAIQIWRSSQSAAGTDAEAYLKGRGITMALPPSLGLAQLRYGYGGTKHPCLIALVSGPQGNAQAIQRTFLAREGKGKAQVSRPKLSLGPISGGAIRLAEPGDELILCEGLEDGLTLQQEIGKPVWVTTGTSNLGKVIIPDAVRIVTIAGDNDPAGRGAVDKAATQYSLLGFEVRKVFPDATCKDFNEQLQKGGRA